MAKRKKEAESLTSAALYGDEAGDVVISPPPEDDDADVAYDGQPRTVYAHGKCGTKTQIGSVLALRYQKEEPDKVYCIKCAKPVPFSDCEWVE